MGAKPTIFGGWVDEDLVPQEPLDIPGRRSPTQPLVEPVEMVTSATPSTIKRAPDPSHRSFTAKTAKHAKNIAKAIAILTHRTIATIFQRGLNASRDLKKFQRKGTMSFAMVIATFAFFAFQ